MPTRSIDLTCEQIDAILIDELKSAVEMNAISMESSPHIKELVRSIMRVLRYYMVHDEYIKYTNEVNIHFEDFDL